MKKKKMAALIAALCCMSTVPCTPLAVTAESSSAEATADNYGFDINGTQKLTLADVAELSKKGYELSLHDFEPYSGKWHINDISCAATFALDDGFFLSIHGDIAGVPQSVWLYKDDSRNGHIDIRQDDVDAYIWNMTNNEDNPEYTEKKIMTLDDVTELSKKGSDISWADLGGYRARRNTSSSGTLSYYYSLENGYILIANGTEEGIENLLLTHYNYNNSIDIRKGGVKEFIDKDSVFEVSEMEYSFDDIYGMTTEDVAELFAEKGLTQEKGCRVYYQGDDAEFIYRYDSAAVLYPDNYLIMRIEDGNDMRYSPTGELRNFWSNDGYVWNQEKVLRSLGLPEEYFDVSVTTSLIRKPDYEVSKSDNPLDLSGYDAYCSCLIKCRADDEKEFAALMNAARNYLQLHPDLYMLSTDEALPYYGQIKSSAQKIAEVISEYMQKSSIPGITSFKAGEASGTVSVGYPEEYDEQVRAYVEGIDTEGVRIDFEPHGKGYDLSGSITAEDYADSISEYMKRNSIRGEALVIREDGVKKISVGYWDEACESQIKAYVSGLGISEELIKYNHYEWTAFNNDAENTQSLKGDTNCDGQVDMGDAVLIMQALANPNKYGENGTAENHLTPQGKINGDMDGNGLTVGDAQSIQLVLLGIANDTDPLEPTTPQPVSFKDTDSAVKAINSGDVSGYTEKYRNDYLKMFVFFRSDGYIYQVKANDEVKLNAEHGTALFPKAAYEDYGTGCYVTFRDKNYHILFYYADADVLSETDGIAEYLGKRMGRSSDKEITVKDKNVSLLLHENGQCYANAFIDENHYFDVIGSVSEEEMTEFLNVFEYEKLSINSGDIKTAVDWYSDTMNEIVSDYWEIVNPSKDHSAVIKSTDELRTYLEVICREKLISHYLEAYDDSFFENNVLFMDSIYQPYGYGRSIYEINDIAFSDGAIDISVKTLTNGGSDVISLSIAVISVPKEKYSGQTVSWTIEKPSVLSDTFF